MRIFLISLLLVTLVACSQETPPVAVQETSTPILQATSIAEVSSAEVRTPIIESHYPDLPASRSEYASTLTSFLNASPDNAGHITEVLQAWEAQQKLPKYYFAPGVASTQYDLNGDGRMEIIAASATLTQSVVIVFEPSLRDKYQASVYPDEDDYGATARIWRVEDINADNKPEIVLFFQGCGAQTCPTVLAIFQWSAGIYTPLLLTGATPQGTELKDTNDDGVREVVAYESGFAFAGSMSRSYRTTYRWNGTHYEKVSHTPDPIDSQDSYWRIIDGTVLLGNNNFNDALSFFEEAIANLAPYKKTEPGRYDLYWSIAQFQRMFIYIQLGNQAKAQEVFTEIEDAKLPHLQWSRAFWDSYALTQNTETACHAAREEAYKNAARLPAYSMAVKSLSIGEVICFNKLEGLSE